MLNEWIPPVASSTSIDQTLLLDFAHHGQRILQGSTVLADKVSTAQQQQALPWLKLKEADWQPVITQLDSTSLFPLAAFFTMAEMQLPGWQCGSKNPAIWIFRWLRKQQQLPNKESVHQLKQLTDNKYIPYGSVL